MLRNTIATIIGIAAAALIAAPIAAADTTDLNNADVAGATTQSLIPEWNSGTGGTFPYATGSNISNPTTVLTDADCNVIRGSWDPVNGFTPGAGDRVAWTDDGGRTLRSSPYKSGLN